ncbi:MAG: copper amine oxidase N-terminal domain-containing protein [Proteocatella sp.]
MKKRLSLLMVLMMVLSLVPMSAFATAGTMPGGTISVDDTQEKTVDEKVTVKLTQAAGTELTTGAQAKLTLNKGTFKDETAIVKSFVGNALVQVGTVVPVDGFLEVAYLTMDANTGVTAEQLGDDVDLFITFNVNFDEEDAGDITLAVEEIASSNIDVAKPILVGTVVVAEDGDMKLSVADATSKISYDGGELSKVTIKDIDENTGADTLVLELPDFLDWDHVKENASDVVTVIALGGTTLTEASGDLVYDANKVTVKIADNTKDLLVKTIVTVDKRDASKGDVTLKVTAKKGTQNLETVDAVIGVVADFDVAMTAVENGKKEIPALYGGDTAKIKVKLSGVKGSFTNGRDIDFTVKGADVTTTTITSSDVTVKAPTTDELKDGVYEDGEFTATVKNAGLDTLEFIMEIDTDYAQNGAVVITAESRDFGTLEADIATVTPAYTVSIEKVTPIKKGESLATANIVIKEAKAGMFDTDETLVLNLDDVNRAGLSFGSNFKVEVTNGLKVDEDLFDENGDDRDELNTIAIEIDSSSTKEAGMITISNVLVMVSGSEVDGNKMLDTYLVEEDDASKAVDLVLGKDEDADADYSVAYVNVVKEYGTMATTTMFKIGSKEYTVNGATMTANEAPYVAGKGYTMLPVRALAESLGLKADWNSATKTASFSNASKVASVVIGADTMYVNGTPFKLSAKAEIKNGSTFIELRSLAAAFGAELQWDAATKMVTVIG